MWTTGDRRDLIGLAVVETTRGLVAWSALLLAAAGLRAAYRHRAAIKRAAAILYDPTAARRAAARPVVWASTLAAVAGLLAGGYFVIRSDPRLVWSGQEYVLGQPAIAFASDGGAVYVASRAGLYRVDAATGQNPVSVAEGGHPLKVRPERLALSGDARLAWLVRGGYGEPCVVEGVDVRESRSLWSVVLRSSVPSQPALSTAEGKLVAVGDGRQVVLLRGATGAEFARLDGHTQDVRGTAFSADSARLVTYSWEPGGTGEVLAWTPPSGTDPFRHERLLASGATAVALHPTRPIALVAQGRQILILNTVSLAITGIFDEDDDIESLAISPDGGRLAVGRAGGRISLWGLERGHPDTPLWGHRDRVCNLSFSSDSMRLVSASVDGTVRVWDVSGLTP